MKTIGEFLKEVRLERGFTLKKLEEKTKIKKSFLGNIENEKWEDLPEYGVVKGFVKSISDVLDIDNDTALALLRRDYSSNRKVAVNPKPDVKQRFSWGPKFTVLIVILVSILSVVAYISYQYISFNQPPKLEVLLPEENEVIKNLKVVVSGTTDPGSVVIVNNQPILVDENGNFSDVVEIKQGSEEIQVFAKSRSGKETQVTRKIKTE